MRTWLRVVQRTWLATVLASTLAVGCAPNADQSLGVSRQPVQSSQRGIYYDVAFAPAPSLNAMALARPNQSADDLVKAFTRELAVQSTPLWSSGSLTAPLFASVGGPPLMAPAPATNRIRLSCGATLISPSIVISAGHCAPSDGKLDELRLQMYRPTPQLALSWIKTQPLSGSWPEMQHPGLGAADGYLIDEYPCTVLTRCYMGNVACMDATSDVSVLECQGRPGDKYGFLNVSTTVPTGQEALMHWKHEVIDVNSADPIPADFMNHYVLLGTRPNNFHYFENAHQLLPLRSIVWPDGSTPRFLTTQDMDIYGCHGSSGSGVLVRQANSPEYQLVGPAALGGPGLSDHLCQQIPNPNGLPTGPGLLGLSLKLKTAQVLLDQYADKIDGDCKMRKVAERDVAALPFAPGSHRPSTLFSFMKCQLDGFAHGGTVAAHPSFGPFPEKFVDDADATEHTLHGFELEANADYRLAFAAQSLGDCAGCPAPQIRIGTMVANAEVTLTAGRTLLTRTFAAPSAGPVEIAIKNTGSKLAVGGFTLIREGQVNSFDVPEDRWEAALYALNIGGDVAVGPVPMRFVGDGSAGFAALLMKGERMALLRQAIGPGRRWTVRLGTSNLWDLSCGLLDLNGAPLLKAPCAAVFALDDRAGVEPRLGFFVELAATSARADADITFVALASDRARDPDGDGVPDVLDNCPGDWNARQEACSEEPPGKDGGATDADAGAGGADGGASDAGGDASDTGGDASDTGAPPDDASLDGGSIGDAISMPPKSNDSSGCACTTTAGNSPAGDASFVLLILFGVVLSGRRRRRRGRFAAPTLPSVCFVVIVAGGGACHGQKAQEVARPSAAGDTPVATSSPSAVPEPNCASLPPDHDRLFKRGAGLIDPYMKLFDRKAADSVTRVQDINEGIACLDRVLLLAPENWAALWVRGKAYQALGGHDRAHQSFRAAYKMHPQNPDVGRELVFECLELGLTAEAVEVADDTLVRSPADAGLRANLALALVLDGRLERARQEVEAAAVQDPNDPVTRTLRARILAIVRHERPVPKSLQELERPGD